MVVLKVGYYITACSPLNSHTNTDAYTHSPHFKNVMLDLTYVRFLFVAGYITRAPSPYLKEWVRGLVDL
jgi:hypothetical protein